MSFNRRMLCKGFVAVTAQVLSTTTKAQTNPPSTENSDSIIAMDRWLSKMAERSKSINFGPLKLRRFSDAFYFLEEEYSWDAGRRMPAYPQIKIPRGFVTQYKSTPKIFWSILPPIEVYTVAATLHDYLYWTQFTSREIADSIFSIALQEADVSRETVVVLTQAVRSFGQFIWNENKSLKKNGEKRVLQELPENSSISWADFKKRPNVFAL